MEKLSVEYKIITTAERGEVKALFRDANWWDNSWDEAFIDDIVANSFRFAGAFEKQKLVGMARALSDGASDAYIQDVIVLKKFRGNQIGSELIRFLAAELKTCGIDWIGLIGEPGTEKFYSRLGFQRMDNYIPMKLEL